MTKHENLAAALAAFQVELPAVHKAASGQVRGNPNYKYADLADINREVLPALGRQGLSFSAKPTLNEAGVFVLAYVLRHESGQDDRGEFPLPAEGTAQEVGSAITYARRYALSAVTGIAPDEDDDGAAASQTSRRQGRPPGERRPSAATEAMKGDPSQARAALAKACEDNGWDLGVVAARFEEGAGVALRDCADAVLIAKFRSSLFKLPQADLMAPATNGAAR